MASLLEEGGTRQRDGESMPLLCAPFFSQKKGQLPVLAGAAGNAPSEGAVSLVVQTFFSRKR